ncbi:MAG: hypothetical protein K2P80_01570 [Beijerinckiaceae bacterium]|nr:hypothetical protein [Beijerinckiaceae bacterium]
MNTNIRDLNDKANDAIHDGVKEASAKADDFINQASQTADTVGRKVSDLASSANSTLQEFGIRTDVMTDKAKRKTSEMQDAVISEIKTNPLRSIAIAAGVGYLFALLSR